MVKVYRDSVEQKHGKEAVHAQEGGAGCTLMRQRRARSCVGQAQVTDDIRMQVV